MLIFAIVYGIAFMIAGCMLYCGPTKAEFDPGKHGHISEAEMRAQRKQQVADIEVMEL